MKTYTLSDIRHGVATLMGEARGETYNARRGVADCILNRAAHDGSIQAACTRPWQFSSWNHTDPNYNLVTRIAKSDQLIIEIASAMHDCLIVFMEALDEHWRWLPTLSGVSGATANCTHYFDDSIAPPTWADPRKFVIKLGRLNFFSLPYP